MKTSKKQSARKGQAPLVIKVERKYRKKEYTIGTLSINGQWICDTMEPHCINWQWEEKVPGKTAIPEGTYKIQMKRSPKFKNHVCILQSTAKADKALYFPDLRFGKDAEMHHSVFY